jgi:ComF family protein
MRSLLHLLKYDGLQPVAERLGGMMAAQLAGLNDLPASMIVVPVPLFAARQRRRGFNQAELLARATVRAMRSQRPDWEGRLAGKVLRRQRATESQAGLSLPERRRNLRGAFFVSDPTMVKSKDVLLIDDIYTTGATARVCAQALRKAGAASVWVATAARAQRHDLLYAPPQQQVKAETEVEMKRDVAFWNGSMALR